MGTKPGVVFELWACASDPQGRTSTAFMRELKTKFVEFLIGQGFEPTPATKVTKFDVGRGRKNKAKEPKRVRRV